MAGWSFHEERPFCGSIGRFASGAARVASGVDAPVRPALPWVGRRGVGVSVTAVDKCGQATKGAGWMSWHREATKDVVACDKPGEAGKRALIPGFPNEETRLATSQSLLPECIGQVERTRGTETSHYPQEKKETSIPSVAASESGRSPNRPSGRGCGRLELKQPSRSLWKVAPQRVIVP